MENSVLQNDFQQLGQWLSSQIVGQKLLVDRLLIALLADGHLLVEGAPGLAKTKAIKTLSDGIEGDFKRIQFTPDLLPTDITGTEIFRPESASFTFEPGPIFHNLILADEINRAPAKVQSALLEAMGERQVSVGHRTMPLPELFLVMATQNPIEQEGTYPLPEAQLDRFLMHIRIGYPNDDAERQILSLARGEAARGATEKPSQQISQETVLQARKQIMTLHMAESVENYLLQLVLATRNPGAYSDELTQWIAFGASPRATISLDRCCRAKAWLDGRDFVSPDDVQDVVHDCLRHRLILNYEAEAEGKTTDDIVDELIRLVPIS